MTDGFEQQCAFCMEKIGTEKGLRRHVGRHLEDIALRTLPQDNDLDDEAGDETSSQSTDHEDFHPPILSELVRQREAAKEDDHRKRRSAEVQAAQADFKKKLEFLKLKNKRSPESTAPAPAPAPISNTPVTAAAGMAPAEEVQAYVCHPKNTEK
jgi:hypothetical protein